ncbi:MAG: Flp family type IVb pilin [Acidimicrobiia bacterium]
MITRLYVWLQTLRDEERGASAVEYGMLVALIAAVIVGTVVLLGPLVKAGFQSIVEALD